MALPKKTSFDSSLNRTLGESVKKGPFRNNLIDYKRGQMPDQLSGQL